MKKSTAALILALSLTACGKRGELQRAPGMAPPPVAYGETKPKGADALLTPSTQATPARSSELLTRSEVRGDDPFDIAPGGAAQPFPGDEAPKAVIAKRRQNAGGKTPPFPLPHN